MKLPILICITQLVLYFSGNEYNWIDTSSTNQENALIAVCGEHLSLKFSLPYTEFLPPTIPFVFQIEGDQLDLSLFVPEVYTSHDILKSLDANAKIINKVRKNTAQCTQ